MARIFDQVKGHNRVIEKLIRLVESARVPNSLLFIGPSGQGKKRVAIGFAQALLCEESRSACGQCPSCKRVANSQSEGLILLEPEKSQIKIEQARAVIEQLSLSKWGRARIVLIDEAHLLNPQAGNALLKCIEEPPPNTHFVLITSSAESVLKTIKSRSQVIRFSWLKKSEVAQFSEEKSDGDVEFHADRIWQELIAGQPAEAVELARLSIVNRESAQRVANRTLENIRSLWVGETKGELSPSLLANLSLQTLALDRDLKGNCDVQLSLENFIHAAHNAILHRHEVMNL